MAKKKITQLDPATSVNSDALFPLSQEDNNEEKTFKGTIEQLGDYINKSQDFNTLNTTSKKVIGAINEVLSASGSDIITTIDTPAPIMTFNDGGDTIPVNALTVAVTAQQAGSGTPAPDNVRALTGWSQAQITRCGKNFYPVKVGRDLFADNRGATHTTNDDILTITMASENNSGVYGGTGTATNNAICQTIKKFSGSFVFSLYAKASVNNSDVYFGFGSFGNTVVTLSTSWQRVELPLTLDSAIHTLNFYNRSGSAITVDVKDVQIEQALSTATPYDAYKGTTVIIPFGDTYYVGVLDVVNGKLTVTHRYDEFDGSSDETWDLYGEDTNVITFRAILGSQIKSYNNSGNGVYNYAIYGNNYQSGKIVCRGSIVNNSNNFFILYAKDLNLGITDLTSWKTYLSNNHFQAVNELATPIEIALTPTQIATLSGLNNIYADCGDIQELEYFNENADEVAELNRAMSDDFHIYSTAEQIVGKWIDGSDIYEKTWDFGSDISISYNSWTNTSILNDNFAVIVSAICRTNTGSYVGDAMVNISGATYVQLQTPRNNNNIGVRYLTLRYTKAS